MSSTIEKKETSHLTIGESVLADLDRAERAMAAKLMMERLEFMHAVEFDHPDGEGMLLDPPELRDMDPIQPFMQAVADPVGPEDFEGPRGTVLSGPQERAMFLKFNYCRYRLVRLAENGGADSPAAVREMIGWLKRVLHMRDQLVNANMPLVLAMAKRTRLSNVDFSELISEGNMALLRAIDKFDAGRGFKFSTYGCRAILKAFSRASSMRSRYHERFPTEFDPDMERSDMLQTRRHQVEQDCTEQLRQILDNNTAQLSSIEMVIIRERFPLEPDVKAGTLEEVGKRVNLTKERVRQIQNSALRKIRQALDSELLVA